MVGSATDTPPHLRPQLDDLALYLSPCQYCDTSEIGLAGFGIPCDHLELVVVLQLRIEPFELNEPNAPVVANERRLVSGQATSTVANTGAEEVGAEPMVEADATRDLDDVRADRLADVCDLVDEADPRHQECIRRELDHLGRGDVRPDDR